jgi:hypothetical protein
VHPLGNFFARFAASLALLVRSHGVAMRYRLRVRHASADGGLWLGTQLFPRYGNFFYIFSTLWKKVFHSVEKRSGAGGEYYDCAQS